ncbi:MFS transporter [Raineyella fluvialis]|uniref:MFS transporter n=1 Tax=Raineyella fluvialis TaxID=2662261 RepID=A0A5Q2FEB7_9ACTN|nr:MFS transporter [Raineyella fluvialis]QGF24147.1 MFS transporter [Raineyella fluvialis]
MTTDTGGALAPTRAERLDRLPYTRQHHRLLVGSGLGWALDAMDVGLISFVMAALALEWHLAAPTLSLIGSIGFVGMTIGAGVGGLMADRLGRRRVFALTLLVYGLATGAAALSWSVAALIVFRFVVGLGLGAELPVASTLVSEYAPRRIRGRMVVFLEAFWAVGWILAALIGYFVIPAFPSGWRWALAVGIVPTLYAVVVRYGLPESVRFLEAKGRTDEAEEAVRRFESSPPILRRVRAPREVVTGVEDIRATSIWARPLARRTAALWIVWFTINLSYYGAFTWLPTLLLGRGFTLTRSFEYVLLITLAQLPGYLAAAWLIERWGRRLTLAVFLLGSAAGAVAFGLVSTVGHPAVGAVLGAGAALSFFNLGAWGALYAIGPELYPTRLRGTGTGAAAAFGRIASILAPLSVPVFLAWGGSANGYLVTFSVFGVAFLVGAAATLLLPEQRGRTLAR